MTTQQYPEHILKQAETMAWNTSDIIHCWSNRSCLSPVNKSEVQNTAIVIRDTLNLPALLMAREENESLKQQTAQLKLVHGQYSTDCENDGLPRIVDWVKLEQQTENIESIKAALSQHQQVVKQLVEALEHYPLEKWWLLKSQALSIAKQLLEKK